jgi:uncharacterized delta-60 repeat protein
MLSPLRLARLFLLLCVSGRAPALTLVPHTGTEPQYYVYSPAIVDGRPAVAWALYDPFTYSYTLSFSRAADANGLAWGAPTLLTAGKSPLRFSFCLKTVNGKPAVCYFDTSLKFVGAVDAAGTSWNAPVKVDTPGFPEGSLLNGFSMEMVDGNPAIACAGWFGSYKLVLIRATDPDGSSWAPPVTVVERDDILYPSMKIVEGHPAIVWVIRGGIWYVRASNAAGSAWDAPVLVEPDAFEPRVAVLEIVNGRPAIGFVTSNENPGYVRAEDATGKTWGTSVYAGIPGEQVWSMSMTVANGHPCMAWRSTYPEGCRFVQARDNDGTGSAAWIFPVTVEAGARAGGGELFTVGGRPAMVYANTTFGLEYLRAADPAGSSWLPPVLQVRGSSGVVVPDAGSEAWGVVAVGTRASRSLTLANTVAGPAELVISGITIDGPDAAEFSFASPPPASVLPAAPFTLSVTCAPVKPGLKSAALHITSDSGGAVHVYDINLTADSTPDISVERPPGTALEDGSGLVFPETSPGAVRDMILTVRNPGGAELNGITITLDGPDRGNFSVTVPPAPVLAPGTATAFTLRLTQTPGGSKTAALHLANNLTGSKNPFDLTVQSPTGLTDPSFRPSVSMIYGIAVQPDRRILIGGTSFVERLLPDGTPDLSFFPPALDRNATVRYLVVQDDGKILVGGGFDRIGGLPRVQIARLLPDGSVDETFAPAAGEVRSLAVQPDGKILCGGFGLGVGPTSLIRLLADGSRDQSFAVSYVGTRSCIALTENGRILAGGDQPALVLLEADGSASAGFTVPYQGHVFALAPLPDGRSLEGGTGETRLRRRFPNGSVDPSVTVSPDGWVFGLALQADGKSLFCSGPSDGPGLALKVARLNADGSWDRGFNPDGQALSGAPASQLALQADGAVLLAKYPASAEGNLVRLLNDPAVTLLKMEDASTVRWLRSGSAPEVSSVTFDLKTPGSPEWTRLGRAARITGGWELNGLTLPPLCQVRARGRAGGSLMEEINSFPSALAWWRLQSFNSSSNTGDAADDADPDHDGLTNFTEYAFGLNPVDRLDNAPPEFKYTNGSLAAAFTAPEGREDVLYRAEWSPAMLPGTWTAIPDTGAGTGHLFAVPAAQGRGFVRFVVTAIQLP